MAAVAKNVITQILQRLYYLIFTLESDYGQRTDRDADFATDQETGHNITSAPQRH